MALSGSFHFPRLLYAVVAVLGFAGIDTPAQAQFETRATQTLPAGAFSVAAGDFNHDGNLDIAVVDNNGFSILLGNGDGTFRVPVIYAGVYNSIAVGDFNGDGNLDLVTANGDSSVSVFLGNGDGTFQSPKTSATTNNCVFVVVGNFNGDRKLDVAVIDTPNISVLLGNGDGTFQAPIDNNSFVGPQWLAVGDFNNDKMLDVVAVGYFGGNQDIGVLLGNGDGTLQSSLTYSLANTPGSVSVADFNRDGNLDVAVGGYIAETVTVLLGNGDGSFQPAVAYDTTGTSGGPVIVSDFKRNGRLDLVVEAASGLAGGIDVFWGNGDGTFQPAQFFGTGESGLPVLGDFNGDHLPDLVLANELFATTVLNTGVASFSPSAPLAFPAQLINTTSARQTVTLTNDGTSALSISSIKVSGEFQISQTCGSSLAAGASCAISAVFRPVSGGTHTGLITLADGASSKPQNIELAGHGTVVKLSPTRLNFGEQKVGTKSAAQALTLTNEGSTAITLSSISVGGEDPEDFPQTNDCLAGAIPPGGGCSVSVAFKPTATGARGGTLNTEVLGGTSPRPVVLSGTGT